MFQILFKTYTHTHTYSIIMVLQSDDADEGNAEKLYEVTDSLLKDNTTVIVNKKNDEM